MLLNGLAEEQPNKKHWFFFFRAGAFLNTVHSATTELIMSVWLSLACYKGISKGERMAREGDGAGNTLGAKLAQRLPIS